VSVVLARIAAAEAEAAAAIRRAAEDRRGRGGSERSLYLGGMAAARRFVDMAPALSWPDLLSLADEHEREVLAYRDLTAWERGYLVGLRLIAEDQQGSLGSGRGRP